MKNALWGFVALTLAGWLSAAQAAAPFEKGALPAKIYVDAYKKYEPLLERAMHIQAESPGCAKVVMGDVSASKSTPDNPVFFVMCENRSGATFNTWYTPEDIESAAPKVARHLGSDAVRQKCVAAIKRKLTQPSSMSADLLDYGVQELPNGRSRARIGFSAANALGAEANHVASCLVGPNLPAEVTITEQ
jgi:hypothetical protein